MSLRDANVLILETGRTAIRAGLGLHELLKTPIIDIPARVGLRKAANGGEDPSASGSKTNGNNTGGPHVNDYLVGPQLDEALVGAGAEDIVVSWPFLNGNVSDWRQAEALWKYVLFNQLQRRRTQNESPVILTLPVPIPSRTEYEYACQIFFERFNVPAFAILDRPIAQLYSANALSGVVVDIGFLKTDITPVHEGGLLHHAHTSTNIGTRTCQHYLAHLLKSNSSVMQAVSPATNPLPERELHFTLVRLAHQLVTAGLVKPPSSGELAAPLEDEGVTDIAAVVVAGKERAVIESGMKKKLNAKATAAELAKAREIEALDLVTVKFEGTEVTVGKERHRFCEPIFDPAVVEGLGLEKFLSGDGEVGPKGEEGLPPLSLRDEHGHKVWALQETVGHTVSQVDPDLRQYLWQGLLVTGEVTQFIKGIGISLQSRLAPFVTSSGLDTDTQPRSIRVLNVPEYYAEYRDTGNGYSAFLGSSIVAKIIFNDHSGSNYVSKIDYGTKGPHAIIEMTPSLL
ncbi:actin-like ATPase domain-containing protein [Coprinopsis marcescibilis]|uniref:Actin-like ATPase domain-containing protein n=1 Tax=Coprinopsis marcescibilis TaxID=230819 RepID=A0A5C3LBB4_COPMA|nr:actin-like ATPase domain-containing protein [Coprinopsis marcescibilis]